MQTETLPKLCHVCGGDVEPVRLWQYERNGVFQPLQARCEVCALRDTINTTYASLAEMYRNLAEQQRRLLALLDGRAPR